MALAATITAAGASHDAAAGLRLEWQSWRRAVVTALVLHDLQLAPQATIDRSVCVAERALVATRSTSGAQGHPRPALASVLGCRGDQTGGLPSGACRELLTGLAMSRQAGD